MIASFEIQWQLLAIQIINFSILLTIVIGISALIIWDCRRRNVSKKSIALWILISVLLFPIGILAYLIVRPGISSTAEDHGNAC